MIFGKDNLNRKPAFAVIDGATLHTIAVANAEPVERNARLDWRRCDGWHRQSMIGCLNYSGIGFTLSLVLITLAAGAGRSLRVTHRAGDQKAARVSVSAEATGRTKQHRISKWRAESISKCAQKPAREQSRFDKEFSALTPGWGARTRTWGSTSSATAAAHASQGCIRRPVARGCAGIAVDYATAVR
jgi:hypothetical protein